MKNLLLSSLFLICLNSYSQSYTLTKNSSTFNSISSSSETVFNSSDFSDYDEGSVLYDFTSTGFNFVYNGSNKHSFYITASGFINFSSDFGESYYGPDGMGVMRIPFEQLRNDDIIAPLWTDLDIRKAYVKLTGTTGSRTMIIEFENSFNYGSQNNLTFQIKLHEGSNNIEFVYGNSTFAGGINDDLVNDSKLSVGLNFKGVTNPTYLGINRLDLDAGLLNTYSSADQTIKYTSGLSFLFSTGPPPPSISISTPTGTLTSNCAGIPSTPITFGVTGSNLTSTVTVSAPAGFEIKTVSSTIYAPSVSLTPEVLDNTVSSTLHIRLLSGATNNVSGTITALSTSGGTTTSATTTVTSTIVSAPTFTGTGTTYNLCKDATYLISLTVSNSYNGWSTSSNTITVNNGYVTAGTSTGPYTVSYTDACAQTVSATVTVGNSDISPPITGQASYKISNSSPIPQGPAASLYIGYNGFNYTSATQPTNTGYYRANNVDLSTKTAGCPYPFYIFRCTTCPD